MHSQKRIHTHYKMKIFSRPIPQGKASTGLIEIGEFNNKEYDFEDTVDLAMLSDGSIWAKVAKSADELPNVVE